MSQPLCRRGWRYCVFPASVAGRAISSPALRSCLATSWSPDARASMSRRRRFRWSGPASRYVAASTATAVSLVEGLPANRINSETSRRSSASGAVTTGPIPRRGAFCAEPLAKRPRRSLRSEPGSWDHRTEARRLSNISWFVEMICAAAEYACWATIMLLISLDESTVELSRDPPTMEPAPPVPAGCST